MKLVIDTAKLVPNVLILGAIGFLIGILTLPITYFLFKSIIPLWSSPLICASFGVFLWGAENIKVIRNVKH